MALIIFTAVLLFVGALVTMIVGYADEYRTVRINYQFENGDTAYDSYIGVFNKDAEINIYVNNPTISGYTAVDDYNQAAPTTHINRTMTDDLTMSITYKPIEVPYTVTFFKQNVLDDDYTEVETLNKSGMTGTYPDYLKNYKYDGFTNLYHKPDFIAADGSTEFELYFSRNYYLINFDLNGGYGVEPVYGKFESTYTIPEPKRKGWVFEGWVLSDDQGNYVDEHGNSLTDEQALTFAKNNKFTGGTVPSHDVSYKAYWSAGDTHYTVVYWIEDPNKAGTYTDVATEEIDKYTDNHHVKTNDTVYVIAPEEQIEDMYVVKDFFSHNLNPQQTEKNDDGTVKLDDQLRPIYVTNADGKPIDDQDNVLDFPEMSPGERNDLNGKEHYFEIDPDKTVSSATISGDGTTCINVYYKRKPITQRFFFARKLNSNNHIEVPGVTKAFSTADGTLDQHLTGSWGGGTTAWMYLSDEMPHLKEDYKGLKIYTYPANNAIYYYFKMETKYGANMRETWLTDAFEPITITKISAANGQQARFGAWSSEWGTPYATKGNKTVKGFYETLDNALLYTNEYLQKKNNAGEYLHEDPTVLNYLSFWTNAQNDRWNKQNEGLVYNFTYKQYVEILPSEYNADGDDLSDAVKASNKYVDTIVIDYDVPPATPSQDGYGQVVLHSDKKIYGLLPTNITETYDAGTQYAELTGPNIPNDGRSPKNNYLDRDEAVKINQTPAALEGFEMLSDAEVAKAKPDGPLDVQYSGGVKRKQNPICNWYATNDFDADHHCDIKFLYRRRYYTLTFINNFEKSSATQTRNIYYQQDINSTGIRGNWVYYEPEYIANVEPELREYYTFDGWRFDEDQEDKIPVLENDTNTGGRSHFNSDFTMPADDVTLYAKWSLKKNNVSFYNDYEVYSDPNGTPLSTCEVEYNDRILTQYIPTTKTDTQDGRPVLTPPVNGAKFVGWYYEDKAGAEQRVEPETFPVVKELKLYAKWNSEQSAGYKVEFVERGTDNAVAEPVTGSAIVSSTKSFRAKANDELNEQYRPQQGQNNWWPAVSSHSILIKPNDEGESYEPNTYRFEYFQKDTVNYKVRYLDATTLKTLHDDVEKTTNQPLVTETYIPINGYLQDKDVKSLVPAASTKSDPAEAKAEELSMNVIVFLYTPSENASVLIEHYLQNVDGNPNDRADYSLHREERITKKKNDPLNLEQDVYGSTVATAMVANHYTINKDLTQVVKKDTTVTEGPIIVDGNPLVVKVYYERSKYPYKVICVDMAQEQLHNIDSSLPDGVLKTTVYKEEADLQPLGAIINITPENPLVLNNGDDRDGTYIPINTTPQPLSIEYEKEEDRNDPKANVKKIYYRKQNSIQINYEIICEGAMEGDLQLSQNREIIKLQTDIKGCTAKDYSGKEGRYTFLGWYQTPSATEYDALTTDYKYVPPLPLNDVTYYAIFQMNSAPYTLNYKYQGRKGGNDGSYIGDDAESDKKVYSVTSELPEDPSLTNETVAKTLVDKAPAIDDLYKDCIWTITNQYVTFDKATRTVTITAVQKPRKCVVKFYYGDHKEEPDTIDIVSLNSLVRRDGDFITAPEKDGDNPFAYWSVVENGKEIARCYSRSFNLRVTGDITVTACYTAEAVNVLSISDPEFTREQYTDESGEVNKDFLYADFILSYMNRENMILLKDSTYKTGLIIEFDRNIKLTKADSPDKVLGENDKLVYEDSQLLSEEELKAFAAGDKTFDLKNDNTRALYKYSVNNASYNNKNRVDKAVRFNNTENFRHYVFRAYYYVIDDNGNTELSEPVYFYLYDIGNSVSATATASAGD